jgi:hypothetical protein
MGWKSSGLLRQGARVDELEHDRLGKIIDSFPGCIFGHQFAGDEALKTAWWLFPQLHTNDILVIAMESYHAKQSLCNFCINGNFGFAGGAS